MCRRLGSGQCWPNGTKQMCSAQQLWLRCYLACCDPCNVCCWRSMCPLSSLLLQAQGRAKLGVEAFAEALLGFVKILAENSG